MLSRSCIVILEALPPWLKPHIKCLLLKPFCSSVHFFNGCIIVAYQRTLIRERNAPRTRRMYSHNDDYDIYMSITNVGVGKYFSTWAPQAPCVWMPFRSIASSRTSTDAPSEMDTKGQRLVSRYIWNGLIRVVWPFCATRTVPEHHS